MITVNLDKAKAIANDIRREVRAEEFKPHDAIIALQLPGADAIAAEEARQAIRDKYAVIQTEIEQAADVETLTTIVHTIKP